MPDDMNDTTADDRMPFRARAETCEKCRHHGTIFQHSSVFPLIWPLSELTREECRHAATLFSEHSVGTPPSIKGPLPVISSNMGAGDDRQQTNAGLIGSSHSLPLAIALEFSRLALKNSIASSRFKLYTRLSFDV